MIVRVDGHISVEDVDEVSFLNHASYGGGDRFGVTEDYIGRKVFINVNNVHTVEVDCTDEEV